MKDVALPSRRVQRCTQGRSNGVAGHRAAAVPALDDDGVPAVEVPLGLHPELGEVLRQLGEELARPCGPAVDAAEADAVQGRPDEVVGEQRQHRRDVAGARRPRSPRARSTLPVAATFGVSVAATTPARGVKISCAGWKVDLGLRVEPRAAIAGPSRCSPNASNAASLSQPSRLELMPPTPAATLLSITSTGAITGTSQIGIRAFNDDHGSALGSRVAAVAYEHNLYQNGFGSDDGNWYLRSTRLAPGHAFPTSAPRFRSTWPSPRLPTASA